MAAQNRNIINVNKSFEFHRVNIFICEHIFFLCHANVVFYTSLYNIIVLLTFFYVSEIKLAFCREIKFQKLKLTQLKII